jgi:hypothetical protein
VKRLLQRAIAVSLLFGLFLVALPLSAAAAESPVAVNRMVFARSVEAREPVGTAVEFDASVAQVFCWTALSTKNPPTVVKHVWYKAGVKLLEVPLTAAYSTGRYWSVKNVSPGEWTVEVVGANGEVLGSGGFKVK